MTLLRPITAVYCSIGRYGYGRVSNVSSVEYSRWFPTQPPGFAIYRRLVGRLLWLALKCFHHHGEWWRKIKDSWPPRPLGGVVGVGGSCFRSPSVLFIVCLIVSIRGIMAIIKRCTVENFNSITFNSTQFFLRYQVDSACLKKKKKLFSGVSISM